jgi:hypothetical protein
MSVAQGLTDSSVGVKILALFTLREDKNVTVLIAPSNSVRINTGYTRIGDNKDFSVFGNAEKVTCFFQCTSFEDNIVGVSS